VLADDVVETVTAGTDTLTLTAHAYLTGDGPVRLVTTGTLPTGLALATDYWIIKTGADTIKLAASFVSAIAAVPTPVDITDAGTGTHTIQDTTTTVRAGQEITVQSRGTRDVILRATCYASATTGASAAVGILQQVVAKTGLPSVRDALVTAGVGIGEFETVRAVDGIMNFASFEPRAILAATLHLVSEVTENVTFIETAEITRDPP